MHYIRKEECPKVARKPNKIINYASSNGLYYATIIWMMFGEKKIKKQEKASRNDGRVSFINLL